MSHRPDHFSEGKHPKQDFQVERIAFFSDAVFAIAITLLVLELKPPVIMKTTTAPELWHELGEMKFKIIAMLLSFGLIVAYWVRHHTLFRHIHNYNRKVIASNMLSLLPIIFFPFTTAFLYESLSSDNELIVVPYRLFFLNHVLAGAAMYFFYYIVMKRFKECSYPMSREEATGFERRLLVMIIAFSLIILLSFFSFKYSFLGAIPVIALRFIKPKKTLPQKNIYARQENSPADN